MKYQLVLLRSLSGLAFALYTFFGTGSVQLQCERLQSNQVVCQRTITDLYGLVKRSQIPLKLTGVKAELVVYGYGYYGRPNTRNEVWLESDKGTLTFPSLKNNSSRTEANEKAERIRQYIQGEGATALELDDDQSVLGQISETLVIGALLLLLNWLLTPLIRRKGMKNEISYRDHQTKA